MILPGLSLKFPRSGQLSADMVLLSTEGPLKFTNYFASEMSNHASPPAALQALQKFQQASGCISMVGLSDFCRFDQDGADVRSLHFPFELLMQPQNPKLIQQDPNATDANVELLSKLSNIAQGSVLFNIFTKASPTEGRVRIG